MSAKQPRTLPCTRGGENEEGEQSGRQSNKRCLACARRDVSRGEYLRRSFGYVEMRSLAGGGQPLDAADEEVVLHGVEVEGVAVAVERNVEMTRDNFAGKHEVCVSCRAAWLLLRMSKIAFNLFNFFPSIGAAQALPVLGGGFQH